MFALHLLLLGVGRALFLLFQQQNNGDLPTQPLESAPWRQQPAFTSTCPVFINHRAFFLAASKGLVKHCADSPKPLSQGNIYRWKSCVYGGTRVSWRTPVVQRLMGDSDPVVDFIWSMSSVGRWEQSLRQKMFAEGTTGTCKETWGGKEEELWSQTHNY